MNNKIASFSANTVPGINIGGKQVADSNGYYNMVLGAFNADNTSGMHYPFTSAVKSLFGNESALQRKIKKGQLRGELDHPDIAGLDVRDAIRRISKIDMDRVTHHIRNVELVESKDEKRKGVILVYGQVRPGGQRGEALADSLSNPDENVAFSIRSLIDTTIERGKIYRRVKSVITYDYVEEEGMTGSNQWDRIALESRIGGLTFTAADLQAAIEAEEHGHTGTESCSGVLTMVRSDLGWVRTPVISLSASLNW